ncbi:hypothetical protein H0H81_012131 [Sphagnurus paluster]|uniref:Uncharacterized protein n=1 Tax=Sphagnurus paluster TaxID=117069 RepID=A0A9P7FQK2_9AGAR|nr:hypothetical protein H0H81_012131 [Sphagnurus paluster]
MSAGTRFASSSATSLPTTSPTNQATYPYPFHSSSQPQPRPSSPSPSLALDMRRLLAKPAPATRNLPHSSYAYSGSDSELSFSDGGSSMGVGATSRRKEAGRDADGMIERGMSTLRDLSFDHGSPLNLSLELQPASPRAPKAAMALSPSSSRSRSRSRSRTRSEGGVLDGVEDPPAPRTIKHKTSMSLLLRGLVYPSGEDAKEKEKEKRPRNVLRKQPSMGGMSSSHSQPSSTANSSPSPSSSSPSSISFTSRPKYQRHATSPHPASLTPAMRSPLPPLTPRSPLTPSTMLVGSPATPLSVGHTSLDQELARAGSDAGGGHSGEASQTDQDGGAPSVRVTHVDGDVQSSILFTSALDPLLALSTFALCLPLSLGLPHALYFPLTLQLARPFSLALSPRFTTLPIPPPDRKPQQHAQQLPLTPGIMPARSSSLTPATTPARSSSLTPAAAVAAAYKRQTALYADYERVLGPEDVADSSNLERVLSRGRDDIEPQSPSSKQPMGKGATDGDGDEEDNGDHAPYYTVFGSSAGRVVAVGTPEDFMSWEYAGILGRRSTVTSGANTSPSSGSGSGLKTLSRKMSERWRRGDKEPERDITGRRGVSMSVDRELGREKEKVKEKGRPSLQERRVATSASTSGRNSKRLTMSGPGGSMGNRRSLRLSIDKFPDELGVLSQGQKDDLELDTTEERLAVPKNTGNSSGPGQSPTSGGGNRIWKLMKRLSSGGLRDKFTYDEEEPPPVPALPKEYASPSPRIAEPREKDRSLPPTPRVVPMHSPSGSISGFAKVVRKKASIVLGVASPGPVTPTRSPLNPTASLPRSPMPSSAYPISPTTPSSQPLPNNARPSTTTRSSSPYSSDVASSRFFSASGSIQRHASAHSSASSLLHDEFGSQPPPVPILHVGQHIIPPRELGRMHSDEGHGLSEESSTAPSSATRASNPYHVDLRQKHSSPSSSSQQHPQTPSPHPRQLTPRKSPSSNPLKKLKLVLPPLPPLMTTNAGSSPKPRRSDDWMIVHTPAAELVSLPLPPRRGSQTQTQIQVDIETPKPGASWGGQPSASAAVAEDDIKWEKAWGNPDRDVDDDEEESRSSSPLIPSFSTANAINTFPTRRTSTDLRRSRPSPVSIPSPREPFPVPILTALGPSLPVPRAARRSLPSSRSTPTSPTSPTLRHVGVPAYEALLPANSSLPRLSTNTNGSDNRRSTGAHSTTSSATVTQPRRRSSSYFSLALSNSPPPVSPTSPASPPRLMTFREMGTAEVLTEQEKAARWDDLLERSARAGGTLHLDMGGRSGEHGLRSDRLRFSEISEIVSL